MNEIYKGMDNAAEQINENFQELVIESGKNEDGHWEKYADGRLECYLNIEIPAVIDVQMGSLYREENGRTWTFPVPFINDDISISMEQIGFGSAGGYMSGIYAHKVDYRLTAPFTMDGSKTFLVSLKAKGRWKE